MADPIEMLEQQQNPPPGDPPQNPPGDPPTNEPERVTMTREEFAQLQMTSEAFRRAQPMLEEMQRRQTQQYAPQPNPADGTNPDDAFWQSPTAATKKLFEEQVTPYARQMAAQLGTMVIGNYKSTRTSDRFFAGVMPIFEKKLSTIETGWLGGLNSAQQTRVLDEAWMAAKGQFLDESERKAPPPLPPANLSGGRASGGGNQPTQSGKKSLEQIDAQAYRMAVQLKWSQEKMDRVAAEIIADQENN